MSYKFWPPHPIIPRLLVFGLLVANYASAQTSYDGPILVEGISVAGENIVFSTNGNIYQVSRTGGIAEALVESTNDDRYPIVSDDGNLVAYSRLNSGNGDVYVYDIANQSEKQFTYHPERDWPSDFTSSGSNDTSSKTLLFSSRRANVMAPRLFEVSLDESWPTPVNLPFAMQGRYSNDNSELYYLPKGTSAVSPRSFYRGGLTSQLFKMELPDGVPIPLITEEFNVYQVSAIHNGIVFLSDQSAVLNVYFYDFTSLEIRALTNFDEVSVTALTADDKGIVYEQDGTIHTMSWETEIHEEIPVNIVLNKELVQPQLANALPLLQTVSSTDNDRFILTARGDIFLFNAETKRARNISNTAGVREQYATISPSGDLLAYFEDESGGNRLSIQQLSNNQKRSYEIETNPGFYLNLHWSPDERHLSFSDQRLGLWLFNVQSQSFQLIAKSKHATQKEFHVSWSPGGRYLAYNLRNEHGVSVIHVFDTETQQSGAVTGSRIYSDFPVFDLNGDYLYFTESPNQELNDLAGFLVASALYDNSRIQSRLSVVSLRQATQAPYLQASRRPNPRISRTLGSQDQDIDWDGIADRIIVLPVELKGIGFLQSLKPGEILFTDREWPVSPTLSAAPSHSLYHLQLFNPARVEKITGDLPGPSPTFYSVIESGEILVRRNGEFRRYRRRSGAWESTLIEVNALPITVDYQQEWNHIFEESWRYTEEHFYDPDHHGYDLQRLKGSYSKFLPGIVSRQGLTTLIDRVKNQLSISHSAVGLGDPGFETYESVNAGLLGAEFVQASGRYKIQKIFQADRSVTTEELGFSPLHATKDVKEGAYLLAINNQQVTTDENLLRYLRGMANAVVRLRFAEDSEGANAFDVEVKALADERALRALSQNSETRALAERIDGDVTYLSIASFRPEHFEKFTSELLGADSSKPLVIDIRYNGGGITGDRLISMLNRDPAYAYLFREGSPLPMPLNATAAPKVLLTNSWNASAAETFPFMYQQTAIGPIVGTRTAGALNGGFGHAYRAIDGGMLSYPARASFHLTEDFMPENHGIAPDHEIEFDVVAWREGRDNQLQEALRIAVDMKQANTIDSEHISMPRHRDTQD